jgi:hypothetical protein
MAIQAKTITDATQVTADNFVRAETDTTLSGFVKQGALGKFNHFRGLAPVEDQHSNAAIVTRFIRSVCTTSMLDQSR